ncbi:cyclic nucleotide-binding domain-containing protein [Neosynechococcus sphagnicola]|uniref:cyclic nucleotide-binding domain-containing protein n=1 Tax=Neosynechococcus sphagnicola TaxID=1501145 RepID=UPI0023BAE3FA|nr:cyclic nucleotide-binding domain-containing protein [Neosynechococcus sphagnicola]
MPVTLFGGVALLVERPIKVGDFIEVNNLLGTVEKISIRATVIRTTDDVSVIVPNFRLIESNIINWSYGDTTTRIHLPVGVAYGTDPVLVTEVLLSVARMHPDVLAYPPPKVWLRHFGDSALQFELLVWISHPPDVEPIKSALNFCINQEFHNHHIEIPVPQQDLRVRNLEGIEALLRSQQLNPGDKGGNPSPTHLGISPPTPEMFSAPMSTDQTLRSLLRQVTYFENCADLDLRILIEHGYRQLFPANQVICHENDLGRSFYLILSGAVEIYSQRLDKYIATLRVGEFFGEMSLLLGIPRSATCRAVEDTVLFVVNHNDLQKLLVNQKQLADEIATKLSERQQALRELGLLETGNLEEPPFIRIRKHLQTLFGI